MADAAIRLRKSTWTQNSYLSKTLHNCPFTEKAFLERERLLEFLGVNFREQLSYFDKLIVDVHFLLDLFIFLGDCDQGFELTHHLSCILLSSCLIRLAPTEIKQALLSSAALTALDIEALELRWFRHHLGHILKRIRKELSIMLLF